jgi:uncharacterized protein YecE (DUF72 family)
VRLQDTNDVFKSALWSYWNQVLKPIHRAGKLGVIIFQFHLGFLPTKENKEYVRWCRQMLDPEYPMAIEFRSRKWFEVGNDPVVKAKYTDADFVQKTVKFARSINCALVAEDDLAHEVLQRFVSLPPGQAPVHLPIHLHVAAPHCLYIRMHRRQGNQRVLADWEWKAWAERLEHARATAEVELTGSIWWLIGTDHEDQPVINSKKLMSALQEFDEARQKEYSERLSLNDPLALSSSPPEPLAFDYPRYFKTVLSRLPGAAQGGQARDGGQMSLGAFFAKPTAAAAAAANGSPAQKSAVKDDAPAAAAGPSTPSRPPAASEVSTAFVPASTLPMPISDAAAKANFVAALTNPPAASSTAAAASSSSSTAAASSSQPSADDLAAQVAAIERACSERERKENAQEVVDMEDEDAPATFASVNASPVKRKGAPSSASAQSSPASAKKMKSASGKKKAPAPAAASGPGIASFFKKA